MNSQNFLRWGGLILVIVGILGFFLIGPTEDSLFGASWWFDNGENWAHLIIGVVAMIVGYTKSMASWQKGLTWVAGILALLVGIWGFVSPDFLGANLENPADNILHLVVGIWAVWAAMKTRSAAMGSSMGGQTM